MGLFSVINYHQVDTGDIIGPIIIMYIIVLVFPSFENYFRQFDRGRGL